jgi:hypothetical protein
VFQYSGAQIDRDGKLGLDPEKIYNVYRPAEELSDPECIESFKLLPWIDGHTMLGKEKDGLTPAEKRMVSGVLGQDVYFDKDDDTLKGNIKVWSENLDEEIENGNKRELSLGYRCKWSPEAGNAFGEAYQITQRNIRGNHVASVAEGRMGSDVAVLDSSDGEENLMITFDSKELVMSPEEMEKVIEKQAAEIAELKEALSKATDAEEEKPAEDMEEKPEEEKPAEDAEEEEKEKPAEDSDEEKDCGMDELKAEVETLSAALDSANKNGFKNVMAEVGKRDALYVDLSKHIGAFAHDTMDEQAMGIYGAGKLGLVCAAGEELATVKGFLHGRTAPAVGHALDASAGDGNSEVNDYIKG